MPVRKPGQPVRACQTASLNNHRRLFETLLADKDITIHDVYDAAKSTLEIVDLEKLSGNFSGSQALEIITKIRFEKPTASSTINNEVVAANYGNFIEVDSLVGVPNVNEMEQWNLRDSAANQGTTIGTAKIRNVEEEIAKR
nr:hypothetical protein [Alteromonas macleodii]